ncbi:riboflavin synthase [Acaryochloris sp. 'Moss Beach']|uniref:riboflavin synthase n=1 Tax=Acaryochloris sp. 'Moss Beach' TaxID=2740837 RepID=UPI001F470865|nr:riboflavin synthase [Acaryochloris sp. 'Moss Beach']UJB70907.1 riboflavin synthase [Acaryochloris sp. 'Moss Beach']
MFTGLIQGLGYLQPQGPQQILVKCGSTPFWEDLAIGDSVAVDGVCLTVETLVAQGFVVSVSPETVQRTTLSQRLHTHQAVNLEPALSVGDRLGGHFVTGHIDDVGVFQGLQQTDTSWELSFTVPDAIARFIIHKGSVAINGVSLTVADCNESGTHFKVAVIPHSFANTNLQDLNPGDQVNIENDVLGKYVAKLLHLPGPSSATTTLPEITPEFLATHGFGNL